MAAPITGIYAGLLALIGFALMQRVGQERLRTNVSLYDGGDAQLGTAIRAHANFTEHVPLAVLLLLVLELNGTPGAWLHAMGAAVVVARVVHPFGLRPDVMKLPARFVGAVGTALATVAAGVGAIWQGLAG